jgi:hypothetical protein
VASFDEAIPPGKVGKVTAQVHTESYRGSVEKTIAVTTSDPTKPSVTLHLKANVIGSVEVLPSAYLGFPRPPQMEYSAKMLIRKDKTETGELKVTDVTTSVPWLIAKARKVESPEPERVGIIPAALPGDWILDVSVSDEAPKGNTGQQVRFKTGLPREPEVTLPASVSLQQGIQAMPANLVMPMPAGSKEASATFTVAVRPGLGKEELKATSTSELFGVTLVPDGERHYKGTVAWKATGENPEKRGTVTISAGGESATVTVAVIEKSAKGPVRPPSAPPVQTQAMP